MIRNWNLKSLLEALSVLTWISLWDILGGLFGWPLMSVNLEFQFLATQITQKNLYKRHRGSRSGCQGSWNQVREESWGREGTSL